jgi:hypothetical protein
MLIGGGILKATKTIRHINSANGDEKINFVFFIFLKKTTFFIPYTDVSLDCP